MTWKLFPATDFGLYAARWQQLNAERADSPLLRPDFVQALLAAFADGAERLAVYERDGQVAALALITRRVSGKWETWQPSQEPVSLWVQRAGLDVPALLAELIRTLPGLPLAFGLTQRDPALDARPADTGHVRTIDYIATAHVVITGSFDDYWNARGKNLRSNLKKQRAKLAKDGVVTRLDVSRAPYEMAAAVADYGRLESAGWKAQGGTAIHPDNAQGLFYRTMLESFAERGAACVCRYWFGEQLVAMDFCIEGHDCLIVLKTTYDESVPNSLSPTLLMREETTRALFDEGRFARLEFYGKVMDWHTKWTDEVRTMYHVTEYRWPVLLGLRQLIQQPLQLAGRLRTQLRGAPR